MNSIFNIPLSHGSKIMVYADDIVLFKPITTDLDLTTFQNDIVSVDSWAKANSLKLNVAKTKAITFSRKRHAPTFRLSLNGSSIPIVTSLKFLGVTLSNNLSWSEHINNICLRSKRQLGLIHWHFHAAPRVARERLYVSTVLLPYLDYCSSVWDPHHQKNIAKLNSVQAFASKVVLQNWSLFRDDRLSTLDWVSLRKRRQIQKLVCVIKLYVIAQYSHLPIFLSSLLSPDLFVIPTICVYMLLLSKLIIINTLSFHLSYLCGTRFLPLFNSLFLLPLSSTFSTIISILMYNNHYCNNNNIITLVIILYFTFLAIINIKIIALFFSIFMFICIISPYYSLILSLGKPFH